MAETDRQTATKGNGKTTHWAITVYEDQWSLMKEMPFQITEWGWQEELCPTTQRKHYQGYAITAKQYRWSGCHGDYKVSTELRNILPGVHWEPAENWSALLEYCKKKETAVSGTSVHKKQTKLYNQYSYAEKLGRQLYELYRLDYQTWSDEGAKNTINLHCRLDIRAGHREIGWIKHNPAWLLYWKDWKDIIMSYETLEQKNSIE